MRAVATIERKTDSGIYAEDSILRFAEGLIGFNDCKNFVLLENEGIAPFRRLQCVDREDVGFLVLDPNIVVKDFVALVPEREWKAIGLNDAVDRLAFAICIIGPSPKESTGNLQAPLIVNYTNMTGRQVILSDTGLSSRQPLT
ncbi:MAG TPA: flagellar assembly protein FliW [Terriglobia bacterium]|nr:flagellar assembly protein FliW [Terriglobia bacterium]